jgi:hypothetical protein
LRVLIRSISTLGPAIHFHSCARFVPFHPRSALRGRPLALLLSSFHVEPCGLWRAMT